EETMPTTLELIPAHTRVTENGNAAAADIRSSATRTFLLTMDIFDQIEQESLDVAIWGSADGENFGAKPILKIPQRFYKGETRQVLDLTIVPNVNFIRAAWELVRWGRVAPHPMFVIGLRAEEVPAMSRVG
ncbi:MAG TPA: hypothetical protein VLW83_00460, partial [Candidatus Acidoferrales bacterium]|nr:hypothetical protein [Candidatus Acidoferrales bacterium]